jgi:hypothetical protein
MLGKMFWLDYDSSSIVHHVPAVVFASTAVWLGGNIGDQSCPYLPILGGAALGEVAGSAVDWSRSIRRSDRSDATGADWTTLFVEEFWAQMGDDREWSEAELSMVATWVNWLSALGASIAASYFAVQHSTTLSSNQQFNDSAHCPQGTLAKCCWLSTLRVLYWTAVSCMLIQHVPVTIETSGFPCQLPSHVRRDGPFVDVRVGDMLSACSEDLWRNREVLFNWQTAARIFEELHDLFDESTGGVREKHLRELGLEEGATWREIRQAFRVRALETHPDKQGGDAEQYRRVYEAYHWLSKGEGSGQRDEL